MKKITIIAALLCSISAFSATRYLLQPYGATTWRTAGANEVNETLASGNSLSAWYNGKFATLVAGDEIWFAAGTYGNGAGITLKSGVSMYGGFVGTETSTSQRSKVSGGKAWEFTYPTIMNGNAPTSTDKNCFITTASVASTYIDGFTITKYNRTSTGTNGVGAKLMDNWIMQNCIVIDNKFNGTGSALCLGVGVNITGSGQLLNSWIYNNQNNRGTSSATANGGGVSMMGTTGALIKGCIIENNTATTSAGGIYCIYANAGNVVNGGGGTIEDCIIRNNTASATFGGGIRAYTNAMAAPLLIKNCQITDNTATAGSGGGMYLDFVSPAAPATQYSISVEGCVIKGNTASTGGGGIFINNGVYTPIKNCDIRDNKLTADADGSALHSAKALTLQNCIFANNSVFTGAAKTTVRLTLESNVYNCTFANNYSGTGSALNLTGVASKVTNCVFWGNTPSANPIINTTLSTLSFNATDGVTITGATVSNNISTLNSTTNNTFVSPTTFVGVPSTSDGGVQKAASAAADWSLMSGCPAINKGTDLAASGVTTDILGSITRPTGANTVDMGAYEYASTTAQTITFAALSAKTYGDASFTLAGTSSSGLTVSYASSNTDVATVSGNTVTIVGAGSTNITASQAGNGSYAYAVATNVVQGLTVNPKTLTIPDAIASNKVYNGTNAAVVTGTLSGIINSDDVTCTTGTFASVNVGNNITVTCILGGAKAANYSLTQPNITANITAASAPSTGGNITALGISAQDLPNTNLTVSSGELVINQTTTVNSVTVAPGAKLTLSSSTPLTATNGITLQSTSTDGTATLVDDYATATVNATVEQYAPQGRNWYITSPISSGNSSSFTNATDATPVVYWNEAGSTWAAASGALTVGKGYISVSNSGAAVTPISFAGLLNSGDVTVPLTRQGSSSVGFNLVGNPYPSYLDWSLVKADVLNANVSTTIWYRTKTSGGTYAFATYNSAGNSVVTNDANTDITKFIPPMQAFWVKVNSPLTSANLVFKNTMRAHKDVTNNKLKAPKAANVEQKTLRLNVSNGSNSDEALILFNSNALNTYDIYDSQKMFEGATATKPEIFTQVGTEKLVINGLNVMQYDTEIPLGFVAKQIGDYSISANELSNFENGTRVILIDKQNPNVETELTNGTAYNFSAPITAANTDRFSLLFRAPGVTTRVDNATKLNAQVFVNSANQITIIGAEKATYSIYNTVGQKIENSIVNSKLHTINYELNTGVYFVELLINGQTEIKKVIIR